MEYYKNLDLQDIVYFCEVDLIHKTEQWKDVIGYEGVYMVSDLGRLKSMNFNHTKKEGIMKQSIDKKGYIRPTLKTKCIQKRFKLHRLVAIAFISNPENKPEVNHIGKYPDGREGNKLDNRVVSLKWSTTSENILHAFKEGLMSSLKGEESHLSKLTIKEVLEIREIGKSESNSNIAIKYIVNTKTIYNILSNKTWKHI